MKKPISEPRGLILITRTLAFVMLCIAGYLLLSGDSAGGAVAGALAFGLAVFQYIPLVTEVSGFGITAKLQREVRQAEQMLEQMRDFALAFAKSNFHYMAWMNRMGTPPVSVVREQVASLDNLLSELGVPEKQRAEAKMPFIMMIGFDLSLILRHAVMQLFNQYRQRVQARIREHTGGKPVAAGDQTYLALDQELRLYSKEHLKIAPHEAERLMNLPQEVEAALRRANVDNPETETLVAEARKVDGILRSCIEAGTKTPEAEDYLERYSRGEKLFEELFPK